MNDLTIARKVLEFKAPEATWEKPRRSSLKSIKTVETRKAIAPKNSANKSRPRARYLYFNYALAMLRPFDYQQSRSLNFESLCRSLQLRVRPKFGQRMEIFT